MWRLATSELSERTVYKDQKLLFLSTVRATIRNIYIDGKSTMSGYFATDTKPIFRSESARYILFIQMSKEMWDFDTEATGDIMFNKVIHGFLPELFKKWMSINAHHVVSIILFARLQYQEQRRQPGIAEGTRHKAFGQTGYQDYYRVVVSDMASNDWINILDQLKREFQSFLREISIEMDDLAADGPKPVIVGKPCEAPKGNLLEAINLASSQFSRDYIDRDLVRTGISIIVITAGSGSYEVDYDMLKLTTETLTGSGIGIDLVCLSPMPLHSVPLFAYRNPRVLESTLPTAAPSPSHSVGDHTPQQHESVLRKMASGTLSKISSDPKPGDWSYAMPHWVDVSYWKGDVNEQAMQLKRRRNAPKMVNFRRPEESEFQPRVRLYGLQMGGLMENEMTNISVPKLHDNPLHPWHRLRHQITGRPVSKETEIRIGEYEQEWMNEYDDYIFLPPLEKRAAEEAARKRAQRSAADASRLTVESRDRGDEYKADTVLSSQPSSYRPGTGYLDWKMKDKAIIPPTAARRKQSTTSLVSNATAESSISRSSPY